MMFTDCLVWPPGFCVHQIFLYSLETVLFWLDFNNIFELLYSPWKLNFFTDFLLFFFTFLDFEDIAILWNSKFLLWLKCDIENIKSWTRIILDLTPQIRNTFLFQDQTSQSMLGSSCPGLTDPPRSVRHPEAVLATEFSQSPDDNTLAAPIQKVATQAV